MRVSSFFFLCLGLLLAAFSQACAPTIKASYSVEKVRQVSSERKMNVVVNINRFEDKRHNLQRNRLSFSRQKKAEEGGVEWCVNSERTYTGRDLPGQIAKQIARHIRKRGNYKGVTHGRFPNADYYLSGQLAAFHGRQAVSIQDAVGKGVGGLVGGLISSSATTQAEIIIAFDNLEIYDRKGQKVLELEPIYGTFQEELPADYACWAIFHNVNRKFKTVVAKLADALDIGIWRAQNKGARGGWK